MVFSYASRIVTLRIARHGVIAAKFQLNNLNIVNAVLLFWIYEF